MMPGPQEGASLTYSERLRAALERIPIHSSIRVGRVVHRTRAEGPGERTAIWVAGCSLRCPGCFNEHLWAADSHPTLSTKEAARLAWQDPGIQGITLLGGEPFDQAQACSELAGVARSLERDVITFTGYTHAQLRSRAVKDVGVAALLQCTDLLVDGPFLQERIDTSRPWLGSTNQRFIAMTDAGERLLPTLEDRDRLEVTIRDDGIVQVNGWAAPDELKALLAIVRGSTTRKTMDAGPGELRGASELQDG